MLKVSVVVPTYKPDAGLDRLIASLDGQTMPADEFEIVFVDDGSPDDTVERLRRAQETRPHIRIETIENSGWPCRPRNVGADLARGEFVAYMDHDDELYPDALRAAYEYAIQTGADVVNGKEARTHDATWAIDTYRADLPQSIGREDQHPLIPMNPHKLYRRAFLQEHGIRFREGGRVMWEDIFFNLQVARHASVVATMASTPYYHWFTTKGSGSTGFLRSGDEFWHWLREVLVATNETLDGDAFAMQRDQLLLHQYRSRVIASFNLEYSTRVEAHREHIYGACRALQQDFGLSRLDGALNASGRMRAHLLAADEPQLLERLTSVDPALAGQGRATSAAWKDGVLEVTASVQWLAPKTQPAALKRAGDRILKALPDDLAGAIPSELQDVTDEVAGATSELGMRSVDSRVVWMAPSTHTADVVDAAGRVAVRGRLRATLDPSTVVFGRPLEPGTWELSARCTMGGTVSQRLVRSKLPAVAWMRESGVDVAYPSAEGFLTLAVGDAPAAVRWLAPSGAEVRDGAIELVLSGLSGAGEVEVEVESATDVKSAFRPQGATLRVEDGRAVLRIEDSAQRLLVRVGDRATRGPQWWVVEVVQGQARLRRGPAPRRSWSLGSARRFARRTASRIARRLGLR